MSKRGQLTAKGKAVARKYMVLQVDCKSYDLPVVNRVRSFRYLAVARVIEIRLCTSHEARFGFPLRRLSIVCCINHGAAKEQQPNKPNQYNRCEHDFTEEMLRMTSLMSHHLSVQASLLLLLLLLALRSSFPLFCSFLVCEEMYASSDI
ncbi:hypothetical protein SAY87_016925 [Trapa incisa]|uniref:Uncharacterized protein n=1 Tax=Trapa incisa TaxID=236973 RepID=A0AAN7LA50_9MYRT|nr:hypothetical protein SAY87_016925 [Trapa incisa]